MWRATPAAKAPWTSAAGCAPPSAGHRGTDARRHGINVVLWRKPALHQPVHQHRLIDDVLWPHPLVALDRAGVAANHIPTCPRC